MHNLLSKLFKKKGITDATKLDQEEKEVFDGYEKVLSKRELTLEEVKTFLGQQIGIIEGKWRDYDYKNKESLIPYHTVYKSILAAINAPEQERSMLEKYLNQLIQ